MLRKELRWKKKGEDIAYFIYENVLRRDCTEGYCYEVSELKFGTITYKITFPPENVKTVGKVVFFPDWSESAESPIKDFDRRIVEALSREGFEVYALLYNQTPCRNFEDLVKDVARDVEPHLAVGSHSGAVLVDLMKKQGYVELVVGINPPKKKRKLEKFLYRIFLPLLELKHAETTNYREKLCYKQQFISADADFSHEKHTYFFEYLAHPTEEGLAEEVAKEIKKEFLEGYSTLST